MEKIGVADYGMKVWYGNFYDYEERLRNVRARGYDGLERLHPMSAEDALMKAARLKELGMGFATCNAPYAEWSIKWTSALGGKYVWAEVSGKDYETYLRQVSEQARVAKKYGVEVVVHNHMGQPVETQEQIETLLSECPDVKLLFDVGHLALAGGDVRHIATKYYDRIAAYHLKGWQTSDTPDAAEWYKRGYFCGLDQGDTFIDNEFVYKRAVKRGFDGWVFIEHDTHKRDPLLDLKDSFEVLKRWRSEI